MSVKNRLKEFIQSENKSVSQFEKEIGVANGYVNSINKSIGLDKIDRIIEFFPNISIDWLITGRGTMSTEPDKSHSSTSPEKVNGQGESYWRGRYDQLKEDYELLLKEIRSLNSASA